MKVKDAQFFTVVSSFLNVYLVKNRSCSSNTVKSYEDALNLLFTFLEGTKDIPRQRVSWSHFTRQNIQEFVDWLEKVRNCSRQTQLQRLAAIRSFVRYGGIVDLRVIAIQADVERIRYRKPPPALVGYLTKEELSIFLAQPNCKKRTGFRNMVFLVLMYDTAARCQEMLDLAYCNKNEKKYFTAELAQQFMLDCYGVQPGTVERRCSRVHRAMDLLSDYQHFNAVMLRRRLNREFPAGLQEGAVNYLQKLSLHGRRENTLRSHRNVLLRFTDYLFSVGVTDYKLLSADIVNRYVKVVSCNYSNSVVRLHYSILLRFFQYLAHSGYKETDLSLKMMPIVKVSASARIPTTLDLSQIESILASVDRESPQGKRDYAVLMIAVKLGIRTSDIRNLRPANFNWEQHLVSFTQVKTGEPITLPLPTDVGWAVIDYLKNGRPVSDAPEIFLRAVAPYVSLQNFDNILIKHMRKAGIPLDSIKHHGLHSLRHSLATHMLDEGIPITSIQGVLGHINADSTQKYIGVNVRQLRSCALEVTD